MAEPVLTEPVIIPCVYLTGAAVEVSRHSVRLIGWVDLPDLGGETTERRIQVRAAMTVGAARVLRDDLVKVLREGRDHS